MGGGGDFMKIPSVAARALLYSVCEKTTVGQIFKESATSVL